MFNYYTEHLIPHCETEKPVHCFKTCQDCCNWPRVTLLRSRSRSDGDLRENEVAPTKKRHLSVSNPPVVNAPNSQVAQICCSGPITICFRPPSPNKNEERPEKKIRTRRSISPCTSTRLFPIASTLRASSSEPEIRYDFSQQESSNDQGILQIIHHGDAQQPTLVSSPVNISDRLESPEVASDVFEDNNSQDSLRQRHHSAASEFQMHERNNTEHTETFSDIEDPPETPEPNIITTDILKEDVLHDLGCKFFDSWPYHIFQKYYHHSVKGIIRCFFTLFIAYQFLAVVLLTICGEGGFQAVLQNTSNMYGEVLHRFLLLALRMCGRVITPMCLFQPSKPAAGLKIPSIGLSREKSLKTLIRIHEQFSPEEEVREVERNPSKAFDLTDEMAKRSIRSLWIVLVHCVLFVSLMVYLGTFLLIEDQLVTRGVCTFKYWNSTSMRLPFFSVNVHPLVLLECVSIFLLLLIIFVAKEFYCYENRIATYAVLVGGRAEEFYKEVRKRWTEVDWYCYIMPLGMVVFVLLSVSSGKVFTPDLTHELDVDDLENWYFWMIMVSVLMFLAASSNRMVKQGCLIGYGIAVVFMCMVEGVGIAVPVAGSSVMILVITTLSSLVFNLLFTLWRCHYHHWRVVGDTHSGVLMVYCMVCMCLLPFLVFVIAYREFIHFTQFLT